MYLQHDSCANEVSVVNILRVIVLVIGAFQVCVLTNWHLEYHHAHPNPR